MLKKFDFYHTWILLLFLSCFSRYAFADLPFITDSASTTEQHQLEFYFYSSIASVTHTTGLTLPTFEIDFGALKGAEVDLSIPILAYIPRRGKNAYGLSDMEANLKYRFINEGKFWPAIAIDPTLELPTGNAKRHLGNGKIWYKLPLWMQKTLGSWLFYGGFGYAFNSAFGAKNFPFGGFVVQRNMSERLALGFELYSQGATARRFVQDAGYVTLLNAGGSYDLYPDLSILFSAGHSISGTKLWVGFLGIYWNTYPCNVSC